MLEFENWLAGVSKDLDEIAPLLNTKLPDEPGKLEDTLRTLESWSYRILVHTADAELYLRATSARWMREAPDGLNVLEKETFLDDHAAPEFRIFRILEGLTGNRHKAGIIQQRISLGQTFLANARALMGGQK